MYQFLDVLKICIRSQANSSSIPTEISSNRHLNINFVRNKFELLSSLIGGKIDILLITETKLDATFPTNQFFIQGYSTMYRLDRNDKGGGIMLFVKDGIISFPLERFSFSRGL